MLQLKKTVEGQFRRHQYVSHEKYIRCCNNFWRVNNNHKGVFTSMFKKIVEQVLAVHSYDTKLFVARFDLHQSNATKSSKHVSEFLRNLKNGLADSHDLTHFGYAWCREESDIIKQHYHLALFFEGHKIRSPHNLLKVVRELWLVVGGSSVHCCNYHNVHIIDEDGLGDIVFHLSYLAKVAGKMSLPSQFKAFSASRLKPKPNKLAS